MRVLCLALAFLKACHAFTSPDIYSITQPAGSSSDPGQASKSATVPGTSRHGTGPASGLNIFIPDYTQDPNWLPLVNSFKSIGIQVKVSQTLNFTSQCRTLLVYTSWDVTYTPTTAQVTTLTSFVQNGGKLIFMSQVPTALRALAGVSAATVNTAGTRSIMRLNNTETTLQALKGFDFTDYYDINMPFYENYTSTGLKNVGYTPVSGAQILASYLIRSTVNSVTVDSADTSTTRSALVKYQPSGATGYVYSFGMDLGYLYLEAENENGGYSENYDGHYYPGYDIGTRIIRNIVYSNDHFVSLWPVPNNMGLAFTTTWDIDTYVSYPHGQGIAAAAQDRGAAGNLNLHVKYITDTYETAYFQYGVPYIYQITGFRTAPDGYPYIDFGSHTVSHSPNAVQFPYGTLSEQYVKGSTSGYSPAIHQCNTGNSDSTPDNGETCIKGGTSGLSFWTSGASASGEVRVSAFLIRYLLNDVFKTNYNLTTYRPGNLAWNKYQSSLCVANGYIGGSSCSGNAHLTHLPFQVGHNREPFQELPYFEFPLQWSDGDGNMSSADFPGSDFRKQVDGIKKMARYGGHYNILIHPSDAIFDKIQIQRALHDAVRPFAVYFNQTGIANWWTNRDRAIVDITATSSSSATMTVQLTGPAEGLTLNVPKTYVFQSATGSISVCQQPSYDTFTNAVVLRNTAKGTYTLTFSISTSTSTASTCPDFTVQPATECIAWDASVDDFLESYYFNNNINILLLPTVATGLTTNYVNGALQLSANTNSGVNSYYTEISRFCFDASVYTHLFFDMIAPAGSSFSIQLVSFDSGCNTEQPSATYLDVSDYALFDGTNHTVQIQLSDFTGQDFAHVRGIKIVNIAPASTPIYVDNIKLQKRCVTAPGDDFTPGLAIESFQNVDRWVTGINNIFGRTDYDNSMASAKLSELGRMQLVPSSASSYFYTGTIVNGVNLNASAYNSISLNVRGPTGGSFDVVVTSGSGNSTSTVNTATVATFSSSNFVNVTIPLSSFSGLDATSVSLIKLQNFTPNGGSAAANTFTVRWISLLGGANVTSPTSRCQSATGYVVLDFCNPQEFKTQTNALGAPLSDDNTMQYYNQTTNGYINLVAQDSTSYFYTLFNTTACATVDSTNTGVLLTVSGPQGATASVGFKHGTTGCKLNAQTDLIPITFNTAPTTLTIPFSRFPSTFNSQYLQSFVMTNFSAPGSVYHIHSLTFIGANSVPGCALCSGTLVDTCTFVSTVPRTNLLSGDVTDEGSLSTYSVASDGALSLGTNLDSYWYTIFGNGCYNATDATGIQLSVAAPANSSLIVALRWMTDAACTTVSSASTVSITTYVTFTGNSTTSNYQLAQIPFTAFSGVNTARLNSLAISSFNPSGVTVKVGCVSLATFSTNTDTSGICDSCPTNAWLNYCASGSASTNAQGGVQSDDGTMGSTPAVMNGALALQPAAAGGSYWYSLMNCADVSSYDTLYINVTAAVGATFNIKLQTSGNACADTTQIQGASVTSSSYATMNGSAVVLAIPFSAYTSQNSAIKLSALYAIVFDTFSSTSAYRFNCAYYGIGGAMNRTLNVTNVLNTTSNGNLSTISTTSGNLSTSATNTANTSTSATNSVDPIVISTSSGNLSSTGTTSSNLSSTGTTSGNLSSTGTTSSNLSSTGTTSGNLSSTGTTSGNLSSTGTTSSNLSTTSPGSSSASTSTPSASTGNSSTSTTNSTGTTTSSGTLTSTSTLTRTSTNASGTASTNSSSSTSNSTNTSKASTSSTSSSSSSSNTSKTSSSSTSSSSNTSKTSSSSSTNSSSNTSKTSSSTTSSSSNTSKSSTSTTPTVVTSTFTTTITSTRVTTTRGRTSSTTFVTTVTSTVTSTKTPTTSSSTTSKSSSTSSSTTSKTTATTTSKGSVLLSLFSELFGRDATATPTATVDRRAEPTQADCHVPEYAAV